jgi:hypothetical protein
MRLPPGPRLFEVSESARCPSSGEFSHLQWLSGVPVLLVGRKVHGNLHPLKTAAFNIKDVSAVEREVACFLSTFGFSEPLALKAVIFDLGGVVVYGNRRGLADRLFSDRDESERPYWMEEVYKTDMWAKLDAGELVSKERCFDLRFF